MVTSYYGLHFIGLFNMLNVACHLNLKSFDSSVGLERLHMFEMFITSTLA
jgi:hypothetical protein